MQASPIPAPMCTTLRLMPQLPTITPRLQPLEFAWPTDARNAWWPAPPLHWQLLYLQQLCRGMSRLTSPIPSLAWACLPTKIAQLSLHEPQSQSTTQTAIQSSQAGKTGPRPWHFPLTTKATNPQDVTGATVPLLPIPAPTPLPAPPPSVTRLPPLSPVVIPPTVPAANPPLSQPGHPCHQHVWGSLLGLLPVGCSPGCCLCIPCCSYPI
jgi:hypothetical protein